MKNLLKRSLAVVLTVVLLLTAAPLGGLVGLDLSGLFEFSAEAAAYSGTCGNNLTWSLDTSTGVLNITGTGAMKNWTFSSSAPWYSYRDYIKSVNIGDSVTTIGEGAFYSCDSLTSVTIGDSVTTIGDDAFAWCDSLTSVTIGDSVTTIGDDAFAWCDSLTSVTIPDSVTTIGVYAFASCDSLTSVTIPDSVTTIGGYAFGSCDSLTSVTIGNSVTTIGDEAFFCCYSLTSVTIPDSVTTIGEGAFYSCDSLTSVTIGNSVTTIGDSAFEFCTSLTDVYYGGTQEQWNKISIGSYNSCLTSATVHYNYRSVAESEYIIFVCDSAGNPIEGAMVTWNDDIDFTDSKGNATFIRATVGEPLITVEKDDYRTYSNEGTNYSKSESGFETIVLYTEQESAYKLKSVYYKNAGVSTDILAGTKRLSTSNADTLIDNGKFSIICAAINTEDVIEYRIYQGTKHIASSTDGTFAGLEISNFETGGNVKIRAYTDEKAYVETPINLIIDADYSVEETTFKIGEKISFEVADSVPFVGGTTLEFDFPALPLDIYVSGNKVHVGINVDLYKTSGKLSDNATAEEIKSWTESMSESVDDIKDTFDTIKRLGGQKVDKKLNGKIAKIMKEKKQFNLPAAGSVDVQFVGYGEGTWSDKGISTVKAYICVTVDASVEKSWQTAVWIIPVAVTLEVGVEGKVSAEVTLDFDSDTLSGDVLFALKPHVEATGAVGIGKALGAGAYGSADLLIEMRLVGTSAPTGLDKVDLTGELGLTAYAGPFVYKRPFAHNTWHLYSRTQGLQLATNSAQTAGGIYDTDSYKTADVSYLENQSAWLASTKNITIGTQSVGGGYNVISSMLTETYRNSAPTVASNGTDTVMVYIGADTARDAGNIACAMYSVYDSGTDTWSEPVQLDSNDTFDSSVYVCSDGEDIWAVYCDASALFSEESTLEDFCVSQMVKAAKFNPETQTFDEPVTVEQADGNYVSVPEIAFVNGAPTVIWQENENADFFGLNSTNEIHYSTFDGTVWSEENVFADGLNSITGYALGEINGEMTVAYITDGDNDLQTTEDRMLFVVNDSASLTDSGVVSNPSFTGDGVLYWYDEGNLSYTSDLSAVNSAFAQSAGFTDNYVVLNNRMIFIGATENSSNLFTSVYSESFGWSNPVQITNQSGYIDSFDAVDVNGKALSVLTQRDVTITEDDVDDSCTLAWTLFSEKNDISVNSVDYDMSGVVCNEDLPLEISVSNLGDTDISEVTVSISDSSGVTVLTKSIAVDLPAGSSAEITADLPLGDTVTLDTYTLEVSVGTTEVDTSNNLFDFKVGYADFNVISEVIHVGKKYTVLVSVTNNSYSASDGKLYIYSITDEEKLIATLDIDELEYNNSQLFAIDVTEETVGNSTCVIEAVAVSTVEGKSDIDNRMQVYIDFAESETFATGSIEAVGESGAVIDDEIQFIYGIAPGLTELEDYIGTTAIGSNVIYNNLYSFIGTGSKLTVKGADGNTLATYTVVIFGDIDGNGWYDANDAFIVNMLSSGVLSADRLSEAQRMAADCNHDGVIDGADFMLLNEASLLLDSVDQTATQAQLETNAVYIAYCSVIDQSVSCEVDPTPDGEPTQTPAEALPETEAEQELDIEAIFSFILSLLERVFLLVISIIG